MVDLVDVYDPMPVSDEALLFLYDLLQNRPEYANISHRRMPTFSEHRMFVGSRPYDAWYLIRSDGKTVGAIYLTGRSEIGIGLRAAFRGKGYGTEAIRRLMALHARGEYFANVAPSNERSMRFFERMGFHHIQNTYRMEAT